MPRTATKDKGIVKMHKKVTTESSGQVARHMADKELRGEGYMRNWIDESMINSDNDGWGFM